MSCSISLPSYDLVCQQTEATFCARGKQEKVKGVVKKRSVMNATNGSPMPELPARLHPGTLSARVLFPRRAVPGQRRTVSPTWDHRGTTPPAAPCCTARSPHRPHCHTRRLGRPSCVSVPLQRSFPPSMQASLLTMSGRVPSLLKKKTTQFQQSTKHTSTLPLLDFTRLTRSQ